MLRIYKIGSHMFQYEEGKAPEGAVEVVYQPTFQKKRKVANKARKPSNKAIEEEKTKDAD